MKLLKPKTIIQYEIDEVKCNCCGKPIINDSFGYTQDYLSVKKHWGYFSTMDTEKHEFDLCEDCYKEIISNFKISVIKDDCEN